MNRARQLGLQNQYVVPACSALAAGRVARRHVHPADRIDDGGHSARTLCTSWTAAEPSPTADATRFMLICTRVSFGNISGECPEKSVMVSEE